MQLAQMLVGTSLLLALALPLGAPSAAAAAAPAAAAPAAPAPSDHAPRLHKRVTDVKPSLVCLRPNAADLPLLQQADPAELERLAAEPKRKRPFCNAFTGCGKKRADESLGTLVELNSEPAVAELSRQILSEAKLWEAIQEARAELLRRRQQQRAMLQLQTNRIAADGPLPLPLTSFRKRRAALAAPEAAPAADAAPAPQ
ncbi:Cardioactive peptide, partial [Gryllus bimaculatus]